MTLRSYVGRAACMTMLIRLFSCAALHGQVPAPPAGFDSSKYDFTVTLIVPLLVIAFLILFVLRSLHKMRHTKRKKFLAENWSPMLEREK